MGLHVEGRPAQGVPEEIVGDLLGAIRGQFCGDLTAKEWAQNRRFFLRVITYPAGWLTRRGVTLAPERYKAVLLEIFSEVKSHGQTDRVKFWPGYLLHCVQEHFKHHGDGLYEEGKATRTVTQRALSQIAGTRPVDPVETLAKAAAVLKVRRPTKKRPAKGAQLDLL